MPTPQFIVDFPQDHLSARAPGETPACLAFGTPRMILRADQLSEVRPILREAERLAKAGAWLVGFVSYEAASAFDAALQTLPHSTHDQSFPLAWFGVFDAPLAENGSFEDISPTLITDAALNQTQNWQADCSAKQFAADVAFLRSAIQEGVAYQINHTLRLHAPALPSADDLALLSRLRAAQTHAYCAYLNLGSGQRILSASPELFFRRDGQNITTRPMKGTAARGRWPAEDRAQAKWLRLSAKNQAENLMIVDLLRNDLSRIAQAHSVKVPTLFEIERYPSVWQMTSTITAQAREDIPLDDLFAALFPCGSITGAPKAKAMELITQRENTPREVYCGAIGLLRPGGDAIFNVAIRTLMLDAQSSRCGAGSGITWDSVAADEYAETLLKTRFLHESRPVFDLFETMRLENGQFVRLADHLARLQGSAEYFDFPFDVPACHHQLKHFATKHHNGIWRVRLSLNAAGQIQLEKFAAPAAIHTAMPFLLANTPVSAQSIWLYHKTTQRQVYEQAHAAGQATEPSIFDVLLWNEAGELTEFTRGNLVVELAGQRYTPPQACGLLDGVLRKEQLAQGQLTERVLTIADLDAATYIGFINSLRGELAMQRLSKPHTSTREKPSRKAG